MDTKAIQMIQSRIQDKKKAVGGIQPSDQSKYGHYQHKSI